jgi:MYXO-CTERM domain-containing protein
MVPDEEDALLRSVVEQLAVIPRLPTSDGERRAAELIRDRLAALGCRVAVEEVPAFSSYPAPIGMLSAAGLAASFARRRSVAVLGGALAAAGVVDDITGRWSVCRRLFMRRRTAWNVVAQCGDPDAAATLYVLAHHDAAPSGVVFAQVVERWLAANRPEIVAAMTQNPPLWWPVIGGPALVALGAALGSRWLRWSGAVCSAGSLAAMIDIGSRPAVPGANDNLSGVAVLVALAARLRARPVANLRVVLVSAGAEEALQEGIRGFARTHLVPPDSRPAWFLNLDTVGSGRLVLLEGEGPVRMHDYDPAFKELVASAAASERIDLWRGLRSRNSTDGVVPSRLGYPTATLVSLDAQKLIPNYHLDTDLPENVDYGCVAQALRLAEAVTRRLAAAPA